GPLWQRRLLDVQLAELPAWLGTRDLSPQGLLGGVQKAWNSYYNKYINVKRGGPAGLSMLLAGYCLLSYSWNYQHISKISFLVSF
ncbi:ATPK synthase, partial [Hemiprocne comata]|nr:ATPK synthase [Hemiprocne comata]